jgi:hypothetical protein
MGGITRRLDHDAGEIDAGRPIFFRRERGTNGMHTREHIGKKMR